MDRNSKICAKFKEMCHTMDTENIISSLTKLKESIKWTKSVSDVDDETFKLLIDLIQMPNTRILDMSLSIIANCCLNPKYRELFKNNGGIPHLVLVLKTIDNDSIACRTSRLIGNLAKDLIIAKELHEHDVGIILVKSLKMHKDMASATMLMTFRGIKKLWKVKECRSKMLPEDFVDIMLSCLDSEDEEIVVLTMETLFMFSNLNVNRDECYNPLTGITSVNYSRKNEYLKIPKEMILKLVKLAKEEKFLKSAVLCLSNFICYHSNQIWEYLEGSGIAEVFIDYFKNVDSIDSVIYQAFCLLCKEGNIRMKVKNAELLPRLLKLSSVSNASKIISIFYNFQFDKVSMAILSKEREFISLLIDNISEREAVSLLLVVSRLEPPVMELVEEGNLNIIIKNCKNVYQLGILDKITRTQRFLKTLITSGKVWEICKAGLDMTEIASTGYAEGLIIHLLSSTDPKSKENASLAVPFLVKASDFQLLYKYLGHYQAMTTILTLLENHPLEERVLASIVRLFSIFRAHSSFYNHTPCFFMLMKQLDDMKKSELEISSIQVDDAKFSKDEIITFEFDNGTCASVSKNLLCKNSPVLDAMLNGHFSESGQERVKLSCCSRDALLNLAKLLNNEMEIKDVPEEVYLELISLTDRFLIFPLNDELTANLKITQSTCLSVFLWSRDAGHTKNNAIIRKRAYEFLLTLSDNLILAMKNDVCREILVKEISNYLSKAFKDLL